MTISKIGKCISAVAAAMAVILIDLLLTCVMQVVHADVSGDFADYIKYLAIPIALTFVCTVAAVIIHRVKRKGADGDKLGAREALLAYASVYGVYRLSDEAGKKFKRSLKIRNIIDLVASQISVLLIIFSVDYLVFFADFKGETLRESLNSAVAVALPLAIFGILIYITRQIISDSISRKLLDTLKHDGRSSKAVSFIVSSDISKGFFAFKKRLREIRIVRGAFVGLSAALLSFGIEFILIKQCVIDLNLILSLAISLGVGLVLGLLTFFIFRKSDKKLAEEMDSEFDLKARVQTMVEYSRDDGDIISLQRQDTDIILSNLSAKKYKFKRLWLYISALALSASVLAVSFIVKDMRKYVPPVEVEPFALSELQEAGLLELIDYVEVSDLEEKFRTPMADEIRNLLTELKIIKTVPDMKAAVIKTMAVLTSITYDSSTATEMLDALWNTDDLYFKHLAVVLDTSSWTEPDWGDFAEKLDAYVGVLMGDTEDEEGSAQKLKNAIDSMQRKLGPVLDSSKLPEDDEMYLIIESLFNHPIMGLSMVAKSVDALSDSDARELLRNNLNIMSEDIYAAISTNRSNAMVGEYVMTRLSSLFFVPVPDFERPEFVKRGLLPDGGSAGGNGDKNEQTGEVDGSVGEGESYASKDLVLDPLTGKYVEYGTLLERYSAIMYERLQNGSYTEEQKEAIIKYFSLLYSGIKDEGKK